MVFHTQLIPRPKLVVRVNPAHPAEPIFTGNFAMPVVKKTSHPSDLSFKKTLSQTIDVFTHFDTKFIRSIKYLMFYPGFLVKAYITGNRVRYAKPMQVFLLANILFYFITHFLQRIDYSPNLGDYRAYQFSFY